MWKIIILLAFIFSYRANALEEPVISEAEGRIQALINKHGDEVYKSFYAIKELRPYSIAQIDTIARLYSNEWIPPEHVLEILTEEDKQELYGDVIKYLNILEESIRGEILDKIGNWCIADRQFDVMINTMGFGMNRILVIAEKMDLTSAAFLDFYHDQKFAPQNLTELQINEAYYTMLDRLASYHRKIQLDYYSEFFEKLSEIDSD